MRLFKSTNDRSVHPLERAYAVGGVALGYGLWAFGFLTDMQVRDWRGLDGSVSGTFSSTLMHAMLLILPLLLGRIFLGIGRREREMRDRVAQMSQAEEIMRLRADRDPLTDLFNRGYLTRRLEEGIATGQWQRRGVLIYMLDLDDFKHINDTFGHRAGDIVLIEIAKRLKQLCRGDDFAARLGGDEFLVMHFPLEGEDPGGFGTRIIEAVSRDVLYEDIRIIAGTSIGIARVGDDGRTWSDVIRSADVALYHAKAEPLSAYRIFAPEMKRQKDEQAILEAEMRTGLDRGEFELYYQPIYGAASGAIRSFEALVRWNHPDRGLVPPMDFIPAAESCGLIVRMGRMILLDACRTAAGWPKPVGICVNLSPVQFKDTNLVETVRQALAVSGLAPGRLDLEITESLLLEPSPRILKTVDALREMGVRITMDDFGTGFSSINNLRRFRFDRLKIDRSFTRDVTTTGADDAEIVRTIVRLSRTLRMETILEGVETEDQLAFARSEGLTEVQGYYCARPMRAPDVARLLAERNQAGNGTDTADAEASAA
ncbi:putative bifunctional diguanylate cyclase/phosphodiesterase [Mangrovicella endophytica]|uniref:putative bifunctional diguanylate cyclase/phosphodiesterase n=1 Tax=Mangrovicella endophytica TaxID=2066697 RepID=UPI000C9E34E7|nr:EAL domain-containing protein [Mangrovicella endophytica]